MAFNSDFFLKKTLGENFLESLEKFELYKPGTKTVLDHEEMKSALMMVPRTLMAFLVNQLTSMNIGENKEIELPIKEKKPLLKITKHERDVYSGEIQDDTEKYKDKIVADFKYRSIPGVGLVIMSTFELYDTDNFIQGKTPTDYGINEDIEEKISHLIDEKLRLNDLINRVIDKKLSEKDAIQNLIIAKLNEISHSKIPEINIIEIPIKKEDVETQSKKERPLEKFLKEHRKKLHKKEFSVHLMKGEQVHCPDCGQNIFNGETFAGCICYGDAIDKKVFLKKTESGIKVKFGKNWDKDNLEMLLEVLRKKNNE